MDFVAVGDQVIARLRQRGRVTYRTHQVKIVHRPASPALLEEPSLVRRLVFCSESSILIRMWVSLVQHELWVGWRHRCALQAGSRDHALLGRYD